MDSENIMIWNPDDDGWQELGGLVSIFRNATTRPGPRHYRLDDRNGRPAITNFKPEFKTWKKCKGMWSTPGILPQPPKKWWIMKPSIRNSRDSIRWWSVTTRIPAWKPGGFHVPYRCSEVCIQPISETYPFLVGWCLHCERPLGAWPNMTPEADILIYCWWFRNLANSPVDIWLIHSRLFGISSINSTIDSHWVSIALLRKIVYFFCWSCEIKKLPSMCC